MRMTAYLNDPDESANRSRRWLAERPVEVTRVTDAGPSRPRLMHLLPEIGPWAITPEGGR